MPLDGQGSQSQNQAELLPVLWARQRLMYLSDLQGSNDEQHRDEIVNLGLRYSLLPRYTSFVTVDETISNPNGDADDVKHPLPLPRGVSELAVAHPVPEPSLYWLRLVLAALFASNRLIREHRHGRL